MSIDFSKHRMSVLLNKGVYRHLHFAVLMSRVYSYSVMTWPHSLAITGDLGGAMFRMNDKDVLGSFQLPGHISYFYWAEKAISAGTGHVYEFDATMVSDYILLRHGDQLGDEADAVVESVGMWMTPEETSVELALLPIPDVDIGEALNAGQALSTPFINQCDAIAWAAQTWFGND